MNLSELIPQIQQLSPTDKIHLLQILASEIAKEQGVTPLTNMQNYPIYTPLNAFEAADTLLKMLENESLND